MDHPWQQLALDKRRRNSELESDLIRRKPDDAANEGWSAFAGSPAIKKKQDIAGIHDAVVVDLSLIHI